MAIVPFPRGLLRGLQWQQQGGRAPVQRSAFTGRARELDFGTAARWTAEGSVIPVRERRPEWAGFEAASQVPGAMFRLPATEGSQFGAAGNLIDNPYFQQGLAGWLLPSLVSLIGVPNEVGGLGLRVDPGPVRAILSNGAARRPALPSRRYYVSTWAYRDVVSVDAQITISWYNAGGALITEVPLSLAPAAGQWQRLRNAFDSPTGTASFALAYSIGSFPTPWLGVTGARFSLFPEVAFVSGSSSAGRVLALEGLAPSVMHLLSGSLLTVPLPNGDEQLVRTTSDMMANASGVATVLLATPLRTPPATGAMVQLDQPWGLMRATHTPGWGARPGGIYDHDFAAEEAF